jgi:UDP-glucose 4-epimerase
MKILLTGGLGYIGSHTAVECLNEGYEVVIVDNLSNSKKEVVNKIKQITGKAVKFYQKDLLDYKGIVKILKKEKPDEVIHFAGYKAVGESVQKPLMYYENNLFSAINMLKAMQECGVNNFIFSSSATVYGNPKTVPITEDFEIGGVTNPYGRTKLMIEEILVDYSKANTNFNAIILRYFNPIGAHSSGLIGENPNGIPNNLMPYISKVATGKLEKLSVFGNDYDTPDGTGVRDYIHVVDLARAHVLSIKKNLENKGLLVYNIGTGNGYSVLDIVKAFEKQNKVKVPYAIVGRRSGDIASCYASSKKAKKELGFECKYTLDDMVKSAYQYEINNK